MMKNYFACITVLLLSANLFAQTSWKGTTSTNWSTGSNWTLGVPTSTVDAIIGDVNFTGAFQPALTGNSACKSLTIGAGSKVSVLAVTKNLTVSGAVIIGSNGTITHSTLATTITLKGNWTNSGTYNATVATAGVTFSGTAQTITGASAFRQITINAGSSTSLANSITVNTGLTVSGTFDPTASYVLGGTGIVTVNSGGVIHVKASDFISNYSISGAISLNARSTVNYSSAAINQTVSSALTYGYLRISGGLVKSLAANLPALNSSNANAGRIYIDAGTFDILTYTANRGGGGGGFFVMAAGSTLRIGGTNGFPSNYNSVTLAASSTVEYYGNNQTVLAVTYGNLWLKSTAGAVVKTMPGTALTVAGNFSCTAGSGTGVTFTAGNKITVNRDVTMDASATFNAGSFAHTFKGSWTNNGIFSGGTSTASFSGVSAVLSGTGTNNFNNLAFSAAGITGAATTTISVSGNLSTGGSGTFTHSSGGMLIMSGIAKTVSGNGFSLSNFSVPGSVTSSPNMTVSGNFAVDGTYTASGGTLSMSGTAKTISGAGTITFNALNFQGTISTANSFTIKSNLSVSLAGSFTASAGLITCNGTTTLSGTANIYSITINGGKTLALGSNSKLGIASVFTKTGTFNVTTNVPNTVEYNSAGAQNIVGGTVLGDYNNLILANGGTKTAATTIRVNNDFTINSGVTFNASSFTFSLYRHFTNNGTFTAGTSTVQLLGGNVANITGATTFNVLAENKTSAVISVNLLNSISTTTLTMTSGNMQTGTNTVTITGTRTGNGLIIGRITHSHAFADATAYYFEGPNNAITFTSPSAGLTVVTVTVTVGVINDFTTGVESILREYDVAIPAGTYTNATWRTHYEDNELNAFYEPSLSLYHYNSGSSVWDSIGMTTRSTVSNYVERTGITTLTGRWALSGIRNVVRWNGSVSSAWENVLNWTTISGPVMTNRVPTSTDDAQIGQAAFTYHPLLTSAQTINILRFGSAQSATLTIGSGGALTTVGAAKGIWTGNASHVVNVGAGSLNIGTNFDLSDGTNGHDIMVSIGSGTVTVTSDLNQSASSLVTFTGNGTLSLGGNFLYTPGAFSCGTGTVIYTGTEAQTVAALTYYNLFFTKSTERATISAPVVVTNNLATSVGGELAISDTLTVAGIFSIGAGNAVFETGTRINIGGNFSNAGSFTVDNGTVNFNGSGSQTVDANTFNTVMVNKSAGTLSLTANLVINSDLTLSSGTLDLSTYLADRSNPGGTLTLGAGTTLKVSGANNYPNYYIGSSINATSTVDYNGTVAQNIADVDYGNLTITNGGVTLKSLLGSIQVNGNMLINSNSTFDPDSNSITLFGNLTNNGVYTSAASTLILKGTSKTLSGTGTSAFYNINVIGGTYTVTAGAISMAGDLFVDVVSSIDLGTGTVIFDGDITNKGTLLSEGICTLTGTRLQTLQFINALSSTSTGTVNFNGTISPLFAGNSPPVFGTLNINNTGGLSPNTPFTVYDACNIAAGCSFNGGPLVHTFYGNFTNYGSVTGIGGGDFQFRPGAPFSASATITLDAVGGNFTSSGEVEFGGTAPITIIDNAPSFNDLQILNTNATGITAPNGWSIGNNMYIGPGATFNAGAGVVNHTINGNLTNNGTLNGGASTITFTGNPVAIDGVGIATYNNLTIATGADLTLNKSLGIAGNLVVDGNFYALGRTVTFTGTGASMISGAAGVVTLGDMDQNKTGSTTTLSVPVIVASELTMIDGIINTTATNLLTLNDDATSSSGTSTSYISGPMKKIGDDAFVFPLGKGGYFARIGISAPASITAAFQAEYFASSYSVTSSVTAPIDHVSLGEYWILNRTAGADNVTATLFWENGTRSGINDLTDIVVAHFDGTNWTDETQSGGTTGSASAGTVTSQTITSFSPFTFGSKTHGGGVNPLPVVLLNFSAEPDQDIVNVTWSTASEENSDYFFVERSADGINFNETGRVKAAGNSSSVKEYSLTDNTPLEGMSYYRLKQTDLNGQFTYSNMVKVNINANREEMIIYPNPAADKFNIQLTKNMKDEILVVVADIFGEEQYSKIAVLSNM